MERRKSTTDNINDTWSICQYYFAHNNGSSDDVLLRHDRRSHLTNKVAKRYSALKRSRTYPLQHQQESRQTTQRRRWTTIKRKQKRQTLANKLSDISTADTGNNSSLKQKWDSIRHRMDNEKVLFEENHAPSLQRNTTTNTTATYLHSSLRNSYQSTIKMSHFTNNNNNNNNNQASTSNNDTQSTTSSKRQDTNDDDDMMVISLPNVAEDIHETNAPVVATAEMPFYFEKKIKLHSDTDMILFILGFLVFPMWWYGTIRYFTETNVHILSKRQRCFQLLNYLFSIASLLVIGLVIGLVTVYT